MEINNIMVIGAGTMGNGIAHVFAQNGFSVTLVDVDDARIDSGLATIKSSLDRQVKEEVLRHAQSTVVSTPRRDLREAA